MALLSTDDMLGTMFEPVLQHRFIMYIDGIQSYLIKKVGGMGYDDGEVIITSVGIQLDEDNGGKKGHIALAQSMDGDHVDNVLYVPVGMIRKMTALQFDGIA